MIVLFQALYYTIGSVYDYFRKKFKDYNQNNVDILTEQESLEVIYNDSLSEANLSDNLSLNNVLDLSDLGFDQPDNSLELAFTEIINEKIIENLMDNTKVLSYSPVNTTECDHDQIDEIFNQVLNGTEQTEGNSFVDSFDSSYIYDNEILDDVTLDDVTYSDSEELIEKFLDNYVGNTEHQQTDKEYVLSFDPPVYIQRYTIVNQLMIDYGGSIKKVVDFGCAEFGFFKYIKKINSLEEILCVDIDRELLDRYITRLYPLNYDYLNPRTSHLNVKVLNGSIANPSIQLMDVDAVVCIEIIEHLYPDTLDALPYNIFGVVRPKIAVFTTPNSEFNIFFPYFNGFRHDDHKFEWTRQEFEDWARNVTLRFPDYTVRFEGIGYGSKGTEGYGACSQMAVFEKQSTFIENIEEETRYKDFFCERLPIDDYECLFCRYEEMYGYDFVSYGVCTYDSAYEFRKNEVKDNTCLHERLSYDEVDTIDFPFDRDERTLEEKILQNAQYNMHRLGGENSRYYNYDMDKATIPLYLLTLMDDGTEISQSQMRDILETAGYEVKLCEIGGATSLCVVYDTYADTMSKSSHKTHTTDTSDVNYCQDTTWEHESVWDSDSNPDENLRSDDDKKSRKSEDVKVTIQPDLNSDDFLSNESTLSFLNKLTDSMVVQTSRNSKSNIQSDLSEIGESSMTNSANTTNKILECIYDSGVQLSNSSVEMLSPEFLKNLQVDKNDKKREATFRAKSEPESIKPATTKNQLKKQIVTTPVINLPSMKSEGNIKIQKKDKKDNVSENTVDVSEENVTEELESDINVQSAEIIEQIPDSSTDNSIDMDTQTEEISNLENFSREVLFDRNSSNSLSEIDFVPGEQTRYQTFRISRNTVSEDNVNFDNAVFPAWLLHLLNSSESESETDNIETEPHFYSQGDGLGIHPSISDLSTDTSSSGTSIPISTVLVLGAGTPGISDNENSDEYYSVDEGNSSTRQSNSNINSTLISSSQINLISNSTLQTHDISFVQNSNSQTPNNPFLSITQNHDGNLPNQNEQIQGTSKKND